MWDRRGCYCRTLKVGQKGVLLQMDSESGTEGGCYRRTLKVGQKGVLLQMDTESWTEGGATADGH